MLNKYVSALIAGVVFGILIGITAIIPCMIIFGFVLMVILGAVTVYVAKGDIKSAMDALLSSGIAGGISGIVGAVVATGGLAAIVAIVKYYNEEAFTTHEMGGFGIYGLICLPVLVVAGVLLSAIGGYIYYEMAVKRNA